MKKAYIFADIGAARSNTNRSDFLTPPGACWQRTNSVGFCFWDGNKTPAISIKRLLLGDVAQEPSAAQWKEARYNGGRISKSYFPDL